MPQPDSTTKIMVGVAVAAMLGFAAFLFAPSSTAPALSEISRFPAEIDRSCRDGRAKIYDECSDQRTILKAAQQRARDENKVLLISYGAEWCIWCHVFSKYIDGEYKSFTHTYSDWDDKRRYTDTIYERAPRDVGAEAADLRAYVAATFVVAHIDSRYAPGGDDVLAAAGIDAEAVDWLPLIFTVKPDGSVGGKFDHDRVENRRDSDDWFRGYDRKKLKILLREMAEAAR